MWREHSARPRPAEPPANPTAAAAAPILHAFATGVDEIGVVVLREPHAPHQEEGVVFLRNAPLRVTRE